MIEIRIRMVSKGQKVDVGVFMKPNESTTELELLYAKKLFDGIKTVVQIIGEEECDNSSILEFEDANCDLAKIMKKRTGFL